MATKDKLPRPIHFPIDCPWPSKEASGIEKAARQRYNELVAKKCHKEIYLIYSAHWASQGIWIEFKLPPITDPDIIIAKHQNKNPQKWIPPPPNKKVEDDDEEGEE